MGGERDQSFPGKRGAFKHGIHDHRPVAPPYRGADKDHIVFFTVRKLPGIGRTGSVPLLLQAKRLIRNTADSKTAIVFFMVFPFCR